MLIARYDKRFTVYGLYFRRIEILPTVINLFEDNICRTSYWNYSSLKDQCSVLRKLP